MRYGLTLAALAAIVVVGCNKSPEGGHTTNSGSTNSSTNSSTSGEKATFTLHAPTLTTTIKQDNSQSVDLTVKRGKDFKEGVKLSATSPSDKIKAEFNKDKVAASDPDDVALKITVAKDAPLGESVIKVTGTPDSGTATSVDVKVNVEKNP